MNRVKHEDNNWIARVKDLTIMNLDEQILLGEKLVQEHVKLGTGKSGERYILGKYLRDWFRPDSYPVRIDDKIESSFSLIVK